MLPKQMCDAKDCSGTVAREMICLPSGGILTMCHHHANKFRAALEEQGAFLCNLDSSEYQATDPIPNQ